MNINIKAQSAIEFVILVMAILFIFVGFLYFIQTKIYDSQFEEITIAVRETALTIQDEISLAHSSADGYSRQFSLPSNLNGKEYTAQILENSIYVKTIDGKHAVALPILNVTGDILIGNNLIYKIDGVVFIN